MKWQSFCLLLWAWTFALFWWVCWLQKGPCQAGCVPRVLGPVGLSVQSPCFVRLFLLRGAVPLAPLTPHT